MTPEQKTVKLWNQRAGNECPDKPTIPDLATRKICAKLILEEALETVAALGFIAGDGFDEWEIRAISLEASAFPPNLTEIADGCADLLVVTLGCASRCGIDLEPVFNDVTRSNNSKWWTVFEIDYEKFPDYSFSPIGDNLYCAKDRTGKVRKPASYSPANIAPILEAQGGGK